MSRDSFFILWLIDFRNKNVLVGGSLTNKKSEFIEFI